MSSPGSGATTSSIGRGGNDVICGGAGADRLVGKSGLDRLYGNAGPDRLFGGDGPDRLFGGVGNDVLAGQVGSDLLDGGPGTDTCYQGQGTGTAASCELPHITLAIAYTDLNGNHIFDKGDVMISRLEDTNDDKVPSAGDTVRMGRYPKNRSPAVLADFGTWGKTTHTVAGLTILETNHVTVHDTDGGYERWWRTAAGSNDEYRDIGGVHDSDIVDLSNAGGTDFIQLDPLSPSQPADTVPQTGGAGTGDDYFIEVELDYSIYS